MRRTVVRELKKALRVATVGEESAKTRLSAEVAALALLERSVRMGHYRLAIRRLKAAVSMNVAVPHEYWRYCREAALSSGDESMQELYIVAAHDATNPGRSGGKGT
jgi:hypothetical protein